MQSFLKTIPYFLISILIGVTAVYAGSLTPPGSAANTMYSLTDLYNLAAGTTTTLGTGTIPGTPGSVSASGKTLTEVYDAISTEIANLANNKIASGISAFGFTGTLYGDTDASKVLDTATYAGTMTTRTLSSVNDTVNAGYYAATTLSAVDTDLTAANIISGATIFGVVGSASSGYTYSTGPRTNQTLCYDAAGATIDCAGTGQDGEYLKGVARSYTTSNVGSDYIVTDNVTGLVWQKCSKGLSGSDCTTGAIETATWADGLTYCNNLDFAGQTDWRLPNIYELYSILDLGDGTSPMINDTYFPATAGSEYLSSTTRAPTPGNLFALSFGGGALASRSKASLTYLRCVRSL